MLRVVPEKNREEYVRVCEHYGNVLKHCVGMYNKKLLTAMEFGGMIAVLYTDTEKKLKKLSRAARWRK